MTPKPGKKSTKKTAFPEKPTEQHQYYNTVQQPNEVGKLVDIEVKQLNLV